MNCRNSLTPRLPRTWGWGKTALLGAAFALFGIQANAQISVSGGSGLAATYTSLSGAGQLFAAINATAQTGNNIVVTITGDATETGAVALAGGAWTTFNISPTGGAARTLSGSVAAALIDFNGADNVTINGLNTGGNSLTISNLSTAATSGTSTITFRTDATSNTITNCSILGSSTMAVGTNGGNIFFGAGAATTGSDNNTVSNCNIGPAGANLPTKGIHFGGTGNLDPGTGNSGNVVNNNNIFDYFGAATTSAGVYVTTGTPAVSITNNRFYQTATRTQSSSGQHSAIWLTNTGSANFTVTGNTIGFANSGGTGTYTFVGTTSSVLIPIFVSVNTTGTVNVNSNIIGGIAQSGSMSGTSSSAPFRGIYVSTGLATCNGNMIGSLSATGSITYTSSSTSTSDVCGMFNFGSSAWTTNNNNVGGITVSNSSTGASNLYGLRCNTSSSVTWTCTGNTIGGTVANSMNSTSNAAGTMVNGLLNSNPLGTFTGNTIRNMTVAGGTGTTSSASMIGICNASSVNQTIGTNTIYNLSNSNTSAATVVTGIQFTGGTTNVVERNNIYGLTSATNSATAELNGIRVAGGTTTYRNNMIALGAGTANALGAVASNSATAGINGFNGALGTDNFWHNSIYIGGTATAGTGASYAFNGTQTTNIRSFRDNIFFNARTNSGATGSHYAVKINGTAANPTGLTINNNVYFANGSGAVFGFYNSLPVTNIAAWRIAVGQDVNSFESNPQYLDPTNAAADLHINPSVPTQVEGSGVSVGVTDDFDGQTRASFTPVDIGADAGNFTALPLCSGTPSTSTITGAASVCTGSGITLGLSLAYTDLLLTYQWRSGTVSGLYPNTLGTSSTQATGPLTVPTYYICEVTCNNGGTFTMTTVEKSVLINALPTVLVNGSGAATGSYCTPGGAAVTLTASGAVSYTWSPTAGLAPTSGSPVSASPTSTTIYTVTGTDGNGCVNTATATITVAQTPQGVTATATPATICSGSTTNLTSTAQAQNTASLANTYTFAGATGTYVAISGTALANGAGDDTGNGNLPIGFTFNYNGTPQTIFSAGSNGLMILGDVTATYTSGYPFSNLLASTVNRIAPLWDDNNTTGGSIQYATTGTAGSRILTVQWTGMHTGGTGSSSNPTINLQVKLYEATGAVQFVYGATSAALSGTTASIGISGASANFISVTPLSPANTSTSSTVTENTGISSATNFPTGTTYTFTPPQLALTYSWAAPGNVVSPSAQNSATTALSGTETFTITVTNAGCPATATATVTVTPLSCSAATVSSPLCAGSNFTVTANTTGGGAPFNYTWSDGIGGLYPNAAAITANLAAGTYNFTCAVTDGCGGSCNSNVTVTVNGLPTPTIAPAGSVNFCVSGTLTSSSATGNVWSPGGAATPSISATNNGSYTVTVTDGNGCMGTSPATLVTISAQPSVVSITPPAPATFCAGGSVGLTALGGTISGTATQTSGTISVAIPDVDATGINNAFTVSGIPGGATIDSVIVTMSMTHSFVQDLIVNLEAPNGQIINLAGGVSGATGSGYTGTRITSNNAAPALLGSAAGHAGTYSADKRTSSFQLTPATPPTTALWSALYSVPNGTWKIRVMDDESIGTGTLTNWQIKVVYSAPTTFTWTPPASGLDVYTGTSVIATPGATQAYTVTSTNGSCNSQANVTVNVQAAPMAGTNGTLNVCSSSTTASLFAQLGGTPDGSGVWTGPSAVIGNNYDASTMTPGVYTYTVNATLPCTVNATATVTVTEQTAPNAGSNGTLLICANADPVDLFASLIGSPEASGTWSGPSALGGGNLGTFTPGSSLAGVYTYTVTATAPCAVNASTTVTVTYNNTDTDGDGFADCVDNCPFIPGQQGDVCDADPGAGFTFGQIDGTCTCVAVPCTENVTIDLRTDLNSQEAGWEILLENTNQVVCKGGYPDTPYLSGITSPITSNCCLPAGNFRLRVLDSMGDGFVSAGFTGGYQLRESGANGRRIIDNFGNFSTGSTSAIANVYENGSFSVPLGDVKPIFSSCDKLDWTYNRFLVTSANSFVTGAFDPTLPRNAQASNLNSGYEYWFFDPNGGFSYRRFISHAYPDVGAPSPGTANTACHFRITNALPANTLLNLRIRGRVNGVNQAFGPACLFKIDAARAYCPEVKLQDDPANVSDYSCGVTKTFGGASQTSNRITANPPYGLAMSPPSPVIRYQFRFRIDAEAICIVRPPQTSAQLVMNWNVAPNAVTKFNTLRCGSTYQVDVRISRDGGATWCVGAAGSSQAAACGDPAPWGKVCNVTISTSTFCPPPMQGGGSSMAQQPEGNGTLTMYPNPNRGDELTIALSEVEAGVRMVSVDIFDLTGQRISARTIAVADGFLNSKVKFDAELASGMYLVNITAGSKTYTERLVIQK